MKISKNWLNSYIVSKKTDTELADLFTQLGLECTVEYKKNNFKNIIIGKVINCHKHPNADKLKLCEVDIGNEILNIVCGAPNIDKNLTVPVAKVGAVIGDFTIKKVKIRDVISNGMICSGKDLGINDDHDGIIILDKNLKKGENINKALQIEDDSIFNFDITPNRGDCFSHLGIARELSIIENKKIKLEAINLKYSDFKTSDLLTVNIEDNNICKRYACRVIKNIKVSESPQWLKNKLNSIGQNSINNIVDLANYIMFDLGQPVHIFDYDKIKNKKINIRLAKNNEKIKCLDKDVKTLSNNDIVIADSKEPIAIAGVIGGLNSHVDKSTKNILIESAIFDEPSIRKTSKKHDYSKEASKRFERGIDCENVIYVMNKFCKMLLDISTGEVSKDYVDIYKNKFNKKNIDFDVDKCNDFLGIRLSKNEVEKIFVKLNINFNKNKNKCLIPSFRNDIIMEVDLFEEIARVYGYNNIPSNTTFTFPIESFVEDNDILDYKIKSVLSNNGFNEHYSNSLYSQSDCKIDDEYKPIELINPLSQDMKYLRNSLLPGLLRALSFNEKRGHYFVKLFELGSINSYSSKSFNKAKQYENLMIVWMGNEIKHWKHSLFQDIYTIKGEINHFFDMLNIRNFNFKLNKSNILNIYIYKKRIGYLKKISNEVKSKFDISSPVYICSINLDLLKNYYTCKNIDYNRINSFPSINRDISILLNVKYPNEEIEKNIYKNGGDKLVNVNLFDLYEGENLPKNTRSMGYALTFRSNEKTLTDIEIDRIMLKIINKLKINFKAIQR